MNKHSIKWFSLTWLAALSACTDTAVESPLYEDATELSGLTFAHQSGEYDQRALPAILGSGVALFDMDEDGDLDIYLVQGRASADNPDQLWRNDSSASRLKFSRVSDVPAFSSDAEGMGVAVGDANADGRLDLLVTTLGANRLLLNTDAGFVLSKSTALENDTVWSASATWLDANLDGRADVYIANVVDYDGEVQCRSRTSRLDYCGFDAYEALHDRLLINTGVNEHGDVVFEDKSHAWGLSTVKSASLTVRVGDFNDDRWPDIFVSSPSANNVYWVNQQGKRYDERALSSGVAASFLNRFHNSFGADAADLDRDGDLDLVVSHGQGQPHYVYFNEGEGGFVSTEIRAKGLSEAHSGAGLVVFDADGDGLNDIFIANGAIRARQTQVDADDSLPLRQTNALFIQNDGTSADQSKFDLSERVTTSLTPRPYVSRSVAAGDLDNDGDIDLVLVNNGAGAQILRNSLDPESWLGIDPVSATTGLSVEGARVKLVQSNQDEVREVRRTRGYLSSSDPRLIYFDLPDNADVIEVLVQWPEGMHETFKVPRTAKYHVLVRGSGTS